MVSIPHCWVTDVARRPSQHPHYVSPVLGPLCGNTEHFVTPCLSLSAPISHVSRHCARVTPTDRRGFGAWLVMSKELYKGESSVTPTDRGRGSGAWLMMSKEIYKGESSVSPTDRARGLGLGW